MLLTNINQLFLISGRCWGDDDDTVHIVEADNEAAAIDIFTTYLRSLTDKDYEDDEIFINITEPLKDAVIGRLPNPVQLVEAGGDDA